jgi:hypothetical protein
MTQSEQDAFLASNFPSFKPDHALNYGDLATLMQKVGAVDVTTQYPGVATYVIQDFWNNLQCFNDLPQARQILTQQLMFLQNG